MRMWGNGIIHAGKSMKYYDSFGTDIKIEKKYIHIYIPFNQIISIWRLYQTEIKAQIDKEYVHCSIIWVAK